MIKTIIVRYLLVLSTILLLYACGTVAPKQVFKPATGDSARTTTPAAADTAVEAYSEPETASMPTTSGVTQPAPETTPMVAPQSAVEKQERIVQPGSGQFISPSAMTLSTSLARTGTEKKPGAEGDITLNFQATTINEFVKVILGDLLQYNYVIDPQVGGTVTIETAIPVGKEELFPLLEEILAMNNAAIIKSNGMYRILPKASAVRGNLAPVTSATQADGGYSVRIIPLTYIAALEMQKILEPFVPDPGNLRVDKRRNLLIIGGTAKELDTLQDTISVFDVDWMRGMSVGLLPLENVDPKTLKTELDSILGGVESTAEGELLDGLIRTVPIERLNSILLISASPSALQTAETWVNRLDRQGELVGQHLYVYNVQNAKATELAEILGKVFMDSPSARENFPAAALAPGTTPVEISGENTGAATQKSAGDAGLVLPSGDSVEIIADDTRNALVILATPQDYKMVLAALQKLDVVPLQVLIEASIIEVTLNDDLNYGVEWYFKNNFDQERSGLGSLDLNVGNSAAGLSGLVPGFSYTIIDSAANVRIALNAIASKSDLNILSAPSLMVLDNQTARINVGDEIPIPSRQSVSNIDPAAPTVNEIQYKNTGVTLEVTPRVNNSGLVTMEIKQEVSDAVTTKSSGIDAPTIQQRQIESTVAINSGETIVLGGLIKNQDTNSKSGVPGLYKIPVLGNLFGTTKDETRRTELLVLITPRVVRNNNDARNITDEFRSKLRRIPPAANQPAR